MHGCHACTGRRGARHCRNGGLAGFEITESDTSGHTGGATPGDPHTGSTRRAAPPMPLPVAASGCQPEYPCQWQRGTCHQCHWYLLIGLRFGGGDGLKLERLRQVRDELFSVLKTYRYADEVVG